MSDRDELLQQVLALPPADRAFLTPALEESLWPAIPQSGDAAAPRALVVRRPRRAIISRDDREFCGLRQRCGLDDFADSTHRMRILLPCG